MRVKRGPTWKWGEQDGGGEGVVQYHHRDAWWHVKWDCGLENDYRVSKDYQDIIPAITEEEKSCSCDGPTKTVEIMNMVIDICDACKKRKA